MRSMSSEPTLPPAANSPADPGGFAYAALLRGVDELAAGVDRLAAGGQSRRDARRLHRRLWRLHDALLRGIGAERFLQEHLTTQVRDGDGKVSADGLLAPALEFLGGRLEACREILGRHWQTLLEWETDDRLAHARADVLRARRLADAAKPEAALPLLRGVLQSAPDHAEAHALLAELRTSAKMDADARRQAVRLARECCLGLRRGAVSLPHVPRTLASDGAGTVFVSAFDDDLSSGLYACDTATGAVRTLRGPDTVYSGTWFDPDLGVLYALIYRSEGRAAYGIDAYAPDGRHLHRRFFDPARLRLELPCILQGGGGRLYFMEYPCRLILAVDPATLQLDEVLQPAMHPLANFKIHGDTLWTTLGPGNALTGRSLRPQPLPSFHGAGITMPLQLDADTERGAVFALSSARPLQGYARQAIWLHRFNMAGQRLFSRPLGRMRPMDLHLMRDSGVLVLADRTAGLIFLNTRRGRGGAGAPCRRTTLRPRAGHLELLYESDPRQHLRHHRGRLPRHLPLPRGPVPRGSGVAAGGARQTVHGQDRGAGLRAPGGASAAAGRVRPSPRPPHERVRLHLHHGPSGGGHLRP